MKCKPIEQLRMTRFFPNATEILERFDDAGTKQLLPVAIHRSTRGERLPRRKEPARERQPVAGLASRKRRKDPWHIGNKGRADFGKEITALELESLTNFICRLLSHHWDLNSRNFFQLLRQFCKAGDFVVVGGVR